MQCIMKGLVIIFYIRSYIKRYSFLLCYKINKHFQHSKFPTIVTLSCITFQHIAKDLMRPHNSLLLYVYTQNHVDDMAHFQFIIVMLHFQKVYCITGMLGEFTFLKF